MRTAKTKRVNKMAKKNRDIEVESTTISPAGVEWREEVYSLVGKYKGEVVYQRSFSALDGKGRINSASVYITRVRNLIREQYVKN